MKEWIEVTEKYPDEIGKYWAEWSDGVVEISDYHSYPMFRIFQRSCGTDEEGIGWDGDVGTVIRWACL